MLASGPVSTVNQNSPDSGIPTDSAQSHPALVDERGIAPHVKLTDKSERKDGTFSRSEFAYDPEGNLYVCPGGKELKKYHRTFSSRATG